MPCTEIEKDVLSFESKYNNKCAVLSPGEQRFSILFILQLLLFWAVSKQKQCMCGLTPKDLRLCRDIPENTYRSHETGRAPFQTAIYSPLQPEVFITITAKPHW
ncbi:polyadenylate-binding protein-interacting protein 2B [Platysternon megacephalum]|uniref:Polyadenylate-binding protein-interacting protein 2B n=1 Tax=Platysternon megacephalum TaxID=55544 RepID=A0A4D9EEU1_9SAUR|nr:polyadenylate-binding protein-interacting protein 2B [Platysternon megacephalum]